jgi:hypothetical protein
MGQKVFVTKYAATVGIFETELGPTVSEALAAKYVHVQGSRGQPILMPKRYVHTDLKAAVRSAQRAISHAQDAVKRKLARLKSMHKEPPVVPWQKAIDALSKIPSEETDG